MIAVFRSELLKIRTTRTFLGLLAGALAFVAFGCGAYWYILREARRLSVDSDLMGQLAADPGPAVIGLAGGAMLFIVTVGVLTTAGDSRHRTADATFLAVPDRVSVVLGKALAAFVTGAAMALAASAFALAVAGPIVASNGYRVRFDGSLLLALVGTVLVLGGMAAIGAGVGALLRNQVGAVVATLAWLLVGEPIVSNFPAANRFTFAGLLGGANGMIVDDTAFSRGPALAVFASYAALVLLAAVVRTQRSDVV